MEFISSPPLQVASRIRAAIAVFVLAIPCPPRAAADPLTPGSPAGPSLSMPTPVPAPEGLDLSTPRRSWMAFQEAARKENWARAAHVLDLVEIPVADRPILGPDQARRLAKLVRIAGSVAPGDLPDELDPASPPEEDPGTWPVTRVRRKGLEAAIRLERVAVPDRPAPAWLVSRDTVAGLAGWEKMLENPSRGGSRTEGLNLGLPGGDLDRTTPRALVRSYLEACREADYLRAASALHLSELAGEEIQSDIGPLLARQLEIVLDGHLWLDLEQISNQPFGKPELRSVPEDEDSLGTVSVERDLVPIHLRRVRTAGSSDPVWVFSPETVAAIPRLYEVHGPGQIGTCLPSLFVRLHLWELELWQLLLLLAWTLLAATLVVPRRALLGRLLERLARSTRTTWDDLLLSFLSGPLRALCFLAAFWTGVRALCLAHPVKQLIAQSLHVLLLGIAGWSCIQAVSFLAELAQHLLVRNVKDASAIRGIQTRVSVVRMLGKFLVGAVALACTLMQFEVVQTIGRGLLASAGLAGLALGLAAQKTLANVLSGLQLGITQPVRLGDEVLFEGEWGWIEEITLTHVVIRIWDLRRLVVPIQYLLDRPVQNWTYRSSEIIGTVFFHADYTVDVAFLREKLGEILEESPFWDGKCPPILSVTDLTSDTVQIRVLVSASTASQAWELRCLVREKMLECLQGHGGRWLPVRRIRIGEPSATRRDPDEAP